MALWCECFNKASKSLSDALELAPTQDAARRLIIRRAFMWYVPLHQVIFQDPRKSSIKNTEVIAMRCTAFFGGDYGALLKKWENLVRSCGSR
jgi:hypothetical protein